MSRHTYSDALRRAAPHLAQHRHGPDMLRAIAEHERQQDEPDPMGWDTAGAVYYVAGLWHGGQWCPLYAAGCVTGFRPGVAWRRPERWSGAADLAAQLVRILRER